MSKKPVHKFFRKLTTQAQYLKCTERRADFSEHVSYFWAKVTCKKCLRTRA